MNRATPLERNRLYDLCAWVVALGIVLGSFAWFAWTIARTF